MNNLTTATQRDDYGRSVTIITDGAREAVLIKVPSQKKWLVNLDTRAIPADFHFVTSRKEGLATIRQSFAS